MLGPVPARVNADDPRRAAPGGRYRRCMTGLLEVDDCILLVIDAQAGFLDKVDRSVASAVVDRIAWLVTLARRLGVPIVVTEEEPGRNGPTHADVVAALGPDHPRHVKPTFGLTRTPAIVDAVGAHGRGTAVLVGLETDVCVAQSALGLLDHGWRTAVVRDAVASPDTSHEHGLARLRDAGVTLVGTKGLAYEWIRSVDRIALLPDRSPAGIVL